MFSIAQTSAQLPPLPEGPAQDNVRGPIAIPSYEPWQIALFSAICFLILCLILWGCLQWYKKKRTRTKTESARATALKTLESASVLAEQDADQFAVLCSAAIRRYFEEGLHITANTVTSEEFLRSLKGNTRLNAAFHVALTDFLRGCDAVKFARQSIDSDQRNELISIAIELVNEAEKTKEVVQP